MSLRMDRISKSSAVTLLVTAEVKRLHLNVIRSGST